MKRYRVMPKEHKVEATGGNIDYATGATSNGTYTYKLGQLRIYVTARDELDAWIKALKWLEQNPQDA